MVALFSKKYASIKMLLKAIILGYIILFSYLSIVRYQNLHSYYYDLGIMDQVVYNTSKGRILQMTNPQTGKTINRMAIHFDPILILLAPFYWLYSSPTTLLIIQSIALGLGAWALFLIGKKILKDKIIAFIFSLSYLFYFPVQRANLFDFHSVVLASGFLLWAIHFKLIKKYYWSFFFIFLSLLTKEHVGLVILFWGIYTSLIEKQKKRGLIMAGIGLGFFILSYSFIIPYFRHQSHFALRYFKSFGASPLTIIMHIIFQPLKTIRYLLQKSELLYSLRLLLPTFYALFSPLTLLIALPEWAINTFSANSNMRWIYFHYNSLIVPFLFYSLILGYRNFNKKIKSKLIKKIVFSIFIIVNLISIYLYNPFPYQLVKQPSRYSRISREKKLIIRKWQTKLKNENIKIATTPKLAPFFTHRKNYFNFLYDTAFRSMGYSEKEIITAKINIYRKADYVIIDRQEIGNLENNSLAVRFYKNFLKDEQFKKLFSKDKIEVYKNK